jgi:hypothetical protein
MIPKIVRQASYSNLIDGLKWHLGNEVGRLGTYLGLDHYLYIFDRTNLRGHMPLCQWQLVA